MNIFWLGAEFGFGFYFAILTTELVSKGVMWIINRKKRKEQ